MDVFRDILIKKKSLDEYDKDKKKRYMYVVTISYNKEYMNFTFPHGMPVI